MGVGRMWLHEGEAEGESEGESEGEGMGGEERAVDENVGCRKEGMERCSVGVRWCEEGSVDLQRGEEELALEFDWKVVGRKDLRGVLVLVLVLGFAGLEGSTDLRPSRMGVMLFGGMFE